MPMTAIAEGSEIKILRYNASTGTLTEHVDETMTHVRRNWESIITSVLRTQPLHR